jgi:hypothetical protein
MSKIYNTTTEETEEILYVANGTDCSSDIMLTSPNITFNKEEDRHEADDDEIRWWENWFKEESYADQLERDLKELEKERKWDDDGWISNRIEESKIEAGWCDFEDGPKEKQRLFRELYSDIKEWVVLKGYDPVQGYWRFEE